MIGIKKSLTTLTLTGMLSLMLIQPASAAFDKARFVADLGMAYFSFHHFVVKPYENHEFDGSAPHHKKALVKAGLALLFAVLEVKHASKIAHKSNDPTLHKVADELDKLTSSFKGMGSKFKGGNFTEGDYKSLGDSFSSASGVVSGAGYDVQDKETKIPGVSDK